VLECLEPVKGRPVRGVSDCGRFVDEVEEVAGFGESHETNHECCVRPLRAPQQEPHRPYAAYSGRHTDEEAHADPGCVADCEEDGVAGCFADFVADSGRFSFDSSYAPACLFVYFYTR
jgi:hypothetical protein